MATGKIARFMGDKGFGFITTDASSDDVFFHISAMGDTQPMEGQEVEFDIEQAPRGPRAVNIKVV